VALRHRAETKEPAARPALLFHRAFARRFRQTGTSRTRSNAAALTDDLVPMRFTRMSDQVCRAASRGRRRRRGSEGSEAS
jgi:hypothetical protein